MVSQKHFVRKIADWGGNRRDVESVKVRAMKYTTDKNALEMITTFYVLIGQTDFLSRITYDVVILRKPVNLVARNEKKSQPAIYKTISRQYTRINKLVDDDLIELIKDAENNQDKIKYYQMIFTQLISRYRPIALQELERTFTFDIEGTLEQDQQFNMKVTEQEFEAAIELLQMTARPFMDMMVSQIDPRMFGYIVHLLQGDKFNLTERDLARKEHMEVSWLLNV